MKRSNIQWVLGLLILLSACLGPAVPSTEPLSTLTAPITSITQSTPISNGLEKIQHFVFIMQENRSFDSYFGTYPGAEGIPAGVCLEDPNGTPCVKPYHDTNNISRGGPHRVEDARADINNGKMDGFVKESYLGITKRGTKPCHMPEPNCVSGRDPHDVMGYHDYHEIPNYWLYARFFVLQDHLFESVASWSLPAHLYMLAAQSGGELGYQHLKQQSFEYPEITELLAGAKIA
jgi:phospholipase C